MPINRLATDLAQQLRARLLPELGEVEVRIFGSVARGHFHEESDLDVLVLVPRRDPSVERRIGEVAWQVAREAGFPFHIAPLVYGREEYRRLVLAGRRLAQEIEQTGVRV